MRLIDAETLENMGYELRRSYQKDAHTLVYEVIKIHEIPTIEAEPVRRGRWKRYGEKEFAFSFNCTECGAFSPYGTITRYCPWCGALMEEEE